MSAARERHGAQIEPASARKVPLLENQPGSPIVEGSPLIGPKNQEKKAISCRWYVNPLGMKIRGASRPTSGSATSRLSWHAPWTGQAAARLVPGWMFIHSATTFDPVSLVQGATPKN